MYDTVFNIETAGETCVVSVASELDVYNVDTFRRYVEEAAATVPCLALSFERCTFIDSSALRPIFAWARARGDAFGVVAPAGSRARRIFDIVDLRAVAAVHETLDDLLTALKRKTEAA